MDRPLLVLFDGHALVHRAFHALPPLSVSKTGEPTGAVYGFVLMLLKVIQDLKPTHWAIAFDRPTPTFRHLEFEEYKAYTDGKPNNMSMHMHWARLIETLHSAEMMRDLLNDPDLQKDDLVTKGKKVKEGVGLIEAPRGTLFHH